MSNQWKVCCALAAAAYNYAASGDNLNTNLTKQCLPSKETAHSFIHKSQTYTAHFFDYELIEMLYSSWS